MPSRRQLLVGPAIMAGTTAATRTAVASGDPFAPDALEADLRAYAGFGHHQSGGAGDTATGHWLSRRLGSAGFAIQRQAIRNPYFEPADVHVAAAGVVTPAIAQHPVTTGRVEAPLALRRDSRDDKALQGRIAVIVLPFARHSSITSPLVRPAIEAVMRAGARAAVLVTDGPTREAIALNAPATGLSMRIPMVVLGPREAAPIVAAAAAGQPGRLVIEGEAGERVAHNIVGRREGVGRAVVVSTPLSGWFACGGERGGGVAAFLALAGWLASALPRLPIVAVGTVGHEFENRGSHVFMDTLAPAAAQTRLWIHLGANFASRDWHELVGPLRPLDTADPQRILVASGPFRDVLARAMRDVPGLQRVYSPDGPLAGEARGVSSRGYEMIAIFGAHRFHHTRRDDASTSSGALIAQAARPLRDALRQILST